MITAQTNIQSLDHNLTIGRSNDQLKPSSSEYGQISTNSRLMIRGITEAEYKQC